MRIAQCIGLCCSSGADDAVQPQATPPPSALASICRSPRRALLPTKKKKPASAHAVQATRAYEVSLTANACFFACAAVRMDVSTV